jgi:two-component system, NarL family, nitrate/nitrite response regulator NarL
MEAQLLTGKQRETFTDIPAEGVQELVRRLAKQVVNSSSQPSARREHSDDAREVILDMEVDGVRCLLVRLPPKPPRAQVMLSPREQEVARMVAKGYPNKTIAAVLDISSWTVGTHLRRIFAKLGVGSRAAMVAHLLQEGLIREQPRQTETSSVRHG